MSAQIQPLHQKPKAQNQGLQRKLFQKAFPSEIGKNKFASPTDNILSPCSQKLNAHRARFYDKSKPTKLNFSNSDEEKEEEEEEEN
ncbi:hypothetical protein PACTADRAFT_51598 [Pachysolen tannophilus NRRL Y-2460]|uniref:Uncharacterized protein n=1 Tax=Pachysolen tannophilus NRRL Y-2460 TaxID=669874 RepID=A0A1E4TQ55_PACTA|nr:hypothetical protein PACTADRAFT_51598 [Pachysolen tannophilus NRRL Y-2460]